MAFVVAAAVAIAALRNADDYWAGGMLLATPLLLCVALIGALCGDERSRARRLGFAILGGGYFTLAFLGLSEQNLVRLPTTWLLHYVHQRVAPPQRFTFTGTYLPGASGRTTFTVSNPKPVRLNVVATSSPMPASAYPVASPNRWKSMLPGAANLEAFSIVGQCLFTLLAGLLGGMIAVWSRRRSRRVEGVLPSGRPAGSSASAGTNQQEETGR
jgi:hypothetical protein